MGEPVSTTRINLQVVFARLAIQVLIVSSAKAQMLHACTVDVSFSKIHTRTHKINNRIRQLQDAYVKTDSKDLNANTERAIYMVHVKMGGSVWKS